VFVVILAGQGACNDAQDLGAFKSHWGTFQNSVDQCATGCLGGADCSASCIQKAIGLTQPCATCFGQGVACVATNCYWKCLAPNSPGCASCSVQYCEGPLLSCAGVPKSDIPI
jgi:hypothetical protein